MRQQARTIVRTSARAAAVAAGNRMMRRNNRTVWTIAEFKDAMATFVDIMWPELNNVPQQRIHRCPTVTTRAGMRGR